MGKAGKDRKRRRLLAEVTVGGTPAAHTTHALKDIDDEDQENSHQHSKTYGGVVSDEDMAVTLRTLLALEQHTDVFRSKACKALRAVVHQLQQTATATTGMGK
jgi:hypothetical protein